MQAAYLFAEPFKSLNWAAAMRTVPGLLLLLAHGPVPSAKNVCPFPAHYSQLVVLGLRDELGHFFLAELAIRSRGLEESGELVLLELSSSHALCLARENTHHSVIHLLHGLSLDRVVSFVELLLLHRPRIKLFVPFFVHLDPFGCAIGNSLLTMQSRLPPFAFLAPRQRMACTGLDSLVVPRIVPTLVVHVLRGELGRCLGFRFGHLVISMDLLFQLVLLGSQHHDLGSNF